MLQSCTTSTAEKFSKRLRPRKSTAYVQWDNFMVFSDFSTFLLFVRFDVDTQAHTRCAEATVDRPRTPDLNNGWGNQFYFNRSILSPRPCYRRTFIDFWQSIRRRLFSLSFIFWVGWFSMSFKLACNRSSARPTIAFSLFKIRLCERRLFVVLNAKFDLSPVIVVLFNNAAAKITLINYWRLWASLCLARRSDIN